MKTKDLKVGDKVWIYSYNQFLLDSEEFKEAIVTKVSSTRVYVEQTTRVYVEQNSYQHTFKYTLKRQGQLPQMALQQYAGNSSIVTDDPEYLNNIKKRKKAHNDFVKRSNLMIDGLTQEQEHEILRTIEKVVKG